MVPVYTLIIDIAQNSNPIDEAKFRERIAPCQAYLDALKGAFDRKPCTLKYYPPDVQNGVSGWSVRAIVLISVGAKRAEYLIQLYHTIARLVALDLPEFDVQYHIDDLHFS